MNKLFIDRSAKAVNPNIQNMKENLLRQMKSIHFKPIRLMFAPIAAANSKRWIKGNESAVFSSKTENYQTNPFGAKDTKI